MSAENIFATIIVFAATLLGTWLISYCGGYKSGVKGIVDLYKNADNWVSVKDDLPDPEEYDWVLVNVMFNEDGSYGVPQVAEYRNGLWWPRDGEFPISELHCTVTHWQPLPEHPKEATQ